LTGVAMGESDARGVRWQGHHPVFFEKRSMNAQSITQERRLLDTNEWYKQLPSRAQDIRLGNVALCMSILMVLLWLHTCERAHP
jgi:hypothetical protein